MIRIVQMGNTTDSVYRRRNSHDNKEKVNNDEELTMFSDRSVVVDETRKNMSSDNSVFEIEDFSPDALESDGLAAVESTHGGSVDIAFIGTGQGGSRLAESFYTLGYKKCLAVNTAEHDLNDIDIPVQQKIHMNIESVGGAGKNRALGAKAANASRQSIFNSMVKFFGKVDRIYITVGAGGGTGSGSTPTLVELATKYISQLGVKDARSKVGVIIALPRKGECASPDVARNAVELLSVVCDSGYFHPVLIVDNERLSKLYSNLTVKKFWPTVNASITRLFHTFNVISAKNTQYTTFDPKDYDSLLSMPGCMTMGYTSMKDVSDSTDLRELIRKNLEKTLFAGDFDLSDAKGVGAVVVGGKKMFEDVGGLMTSIEAGFDSIASSTGNALVHRGVYEVDADKLSVHVLITGLFRPTDRIDELKSLAETK